MTTLRQRMVEELQRRNYSPATIRGYVLAIKQFADYFGKPPDRLGATHIQRFQWYLLQERKLAPLTVEIRMSACGSSSRRCSNAATSTSMICRFPKHHGNYPRFSVARKSVA